MWGHEEGSEHLIESFLRNVLFVGSSVVNDHNALGFALAGVLWFDLGFNFSEKFSKRLGIR